MRTLITACALLLSASAVTAQVTPQRWLEIRPTAGVLIPTGSQRDVMNDAGLYGMQLSYQLQPDIHLVGSFAWTPTNHKLTATDKGVHLYQYDVGAEFNLIRRINDGWQFKPFLGLGAGARTYQYDNASLGTKTCQAGYAAVGTEFQTNVTALRLEARNHLYCYNDPVQGGQLTRNDVSISAGIALHVLGH